jgi:hypothetical protein
MLEWEKKLIPLLVTILVMNNVRKTLALIPRILCEHVGIHIDPEKLAIQFPDGSLGR